MRHLRMLRWIGCAAVVAGALLPAVADAQVTAYAYVPGTDDGKLYVIDTRTGTLMPSPASIGSSPIFISPSPDGRWIYVRRQEGGNDFAILDAETMTPLSGIPFASNDPQLTVWGAKVSPNGAQVWFTDEGGDSRVRVYDVATQSFVAEIILMLPAFDVLFSADSQRAYVAAYDSLYVYDTATYAIVGGPIAIDYLAFHIVFSPDGKTLYAANSGFDEVSLIDVDTLTVFAKIPLSGAPVGVAITPDGQTLFVGRGNIDKVGVINLATNTVVGSIAVGQSPAGMALTPDGRKLYVINSSSNSVSIINVATRTVTSTIPLAGVTSISNTDFIGPPILTTNCSGCGLFSIAGDGDLTANGFKNFVVFNSGGLKLTGNWTTTRALSLLSQGGTIDTNGFDATISGDVLYSGALTKQGIGRLILAGTEKHTGGTTVTNGALILNGTHTASAIHVQGGTLGGNGTAGAVDVATGGTIDPGNGGPAVLSASQVTLTAGSTFSVQVNGPAVGTDYDRLDVSGTATLSQATLSVQLGSGYTPTPGTTYTILTHASGTFAGLPEGGTVLVGAQPFTISYRGGNSGTDVVLTADEPIPPPPPPPPDVPPTISTLSDVQVIAGQALAPIPFHVDDDLTAASALVITTMSSNHILLPDVDIVVGGTNNDRLLTLTPVPGASGTTTITVGVSDGINAAVTETFTLTVIPVPVYYLAEGSTGGFFATDILIANPNQTAANAVMTFYKTDGSTVVKPVVLPATSRLTVRVNDIPGLEATAFSTAVASIDALPLAVERTMWWDASGYGASTEKASPGAAAQWYFAEGAQGFFHTYFLLLNPHAVDTISHVTYYPEDGPALSRDYTVSASSRRTIDIADEPALLNRSFGALVTFDLPGMAERAMYFGTTPMYDGGTAAAGVTAPATRWYLAEGATGSFFDTFVLIANPNDVATDVTLTYVPANGVPIAKTHNVAAHARLTVNIATEDPSLASAAVSTQVDATQPVIAERSQYWPHGGWYEAHNSAGETSAGTNWALAEGRVGGTSHAQTYILLANSGTQPADVTTTFLRENGTTVVKTFTVPPTSRVNIAVTGPGSDVPELANENFGTALVSTQPIIVERSMYTDANGVVWAAGTNATGTRLPEN